MLLVDVRSVRSSSRKSRPSRDESAKKPTDDRKLPNSVAPTKSVAPGWNANGNWRWNDRDSWKSRDDVKRWKDRGPRTNSKISCYHLVVDSHVLIVLRLCSRSTANVHVQFLGGFEVAGYVLNVSCVDGKCSLVVQFW